MLFARVVVGLPIEGPFDYLIPPTLENKIKPGMRVRVSFGPQRLVGYVVSVSRKSRISKIKPIIDTIDDSPVLDNLGLELTRKIADYYCCSWGQAIETALPKPLRKGKKINQPLLGALEVLPKENSTGGVICLQAKERLGFYLEEIKNTLSSSQSVIILVPDYDSIQAVEEKIKSACGINPIILHRSESEELNRWIEIRNAPACAVIGTRSAVFAPCNRLGLIIIEDEEQAVYKQDQVPHYHAREVARWRMELAGGRVILGSISPSLEVVREVKEQAIIYKKINQDTAYPEVRVIESKYFSTGKNRAFAFSKYLEDAISQALENKAKALLFLNRKGYATSAVCQSCGKTLKCPRCSVNLVYHFKEKILRCHYCNFRMPAVSICPQCNAGYIRYTGAGTERIENELERIFPFARIANLDTKMVSIDEADIFVATEAVIHRSGYIFDVIGVLGVDNSLQRVDLRSAEKTFGILLGLVGITKKLIIQTGISSHYCFKSLVENNADIFYDEELKQRKQLKFPPYKHLALVKIRAEKEEKAEEASRGIFEKLSAIRCPGIEVIALNPGQPARLRGKFYWQILVRGASAYLLTKFLKTNLKKLPHSGIIVTVDVDPV